MVFLLQLKKERTFKSLYLKVDEGWLAPSRYNMVITQRYILSSQWCPFVFHHCYVTGCWIGCSCVTGHLIGLLEILGTLSITAGELKQLISLFRVDEEGKQVCSLFQACECVYVRVSVYVCVCVRVPLGFQ